MNKKSPLSRSGRFTSGLGEDVAKFTESISFDRRLWRHDLLGSIAHATMLGNIGVLSKAESKRIVKVLEAIGVDIEEGRFEWNESLEDVHMNIEAELTRREPAGAKLHTGRSRNDQVALDMRMWLRDEMVELEVEISSLQRSLVELGVKNDKVILPGYTHLQRAQPVYFAHHLLAYVEMFARDHERLLDAFSRVNVCPLGSGALAGSTLPLDRKQVAEFLGFEDSKGRPVISQNSMDAVSDRDFAVEFCFIASMTGVHLSRLAEDLILWSSSEFDYIRISDEYTTGSSLMPQKKNPDFAEVIKSKASLAHGMLSGLLSIQKGAMSGYNRDTQVTKYLVMDLIRECEEAPLILRGVFESLIINTVKMNEKCETGFLNSVDIADHLARNMELPFRECYHMLSRAVTLSEPETKITSSALQKTLIEFGHPTEIALDLEQFNNPRKLVEQRHHQGSPSPEQTSLQIEEFSEQLKLFSTPIEDLQKHVLNKHEECRNYAV